MGIVCPAGATVDGIDVSYYQATVDWAMAKSAGIVFGYARIAENTTPDPQFATNWSAMQANGVVRGAYQYFHPGSDPAAQASYVVSVLGHLAPEDLPVAVDVETTDGQSPATIAANLATFVDMVAAGTGKQPVIWTGKNVWEGSVQSSAFASDPLWIGNWGVSCPNLPSAWTSWVIWQDSNTATVAGVSGNVDHDKFNGSAGDLATFAGMTPPADDLPARDVSDVFDASPEADAGNGQPAAGKGGGCCDAGGTSDAAGVLLIVLASAFRRRRAVPSGTARHDPECE
jgi:GH25 family lysozyme M1 (1,4-beta-N-acetylmuramidase)